MSRSLKWTRLVRHETTSSNGVVRLFRFHMSEIVRRALGKEKKKMAWTRANRQTEAIFLHVNISIYQQMINEYENIRIGEVKKPSLLKYATRDLPLT